MKTFFRILSIITGWALLIFICKTIWNLINSKINKARKLKEEAARKLKEEIEYKARKLKEEAEREALLEKYRTEYGEEIVESYRNCRIKFGMPQQMVIDIYGEPDDIKKERTTKTLKEEYFYGKAGEYISGKTSTYKIRVDFKNGEVSGFKEY